VGLKICPGATCGSQIVVEPRWVSCIYFILHWHSRSFNL